MQTGQKLQKLRQQTDMTQEQLAERLFVSRDLVSKWETGERRPNYKTVIRISEILGVSPDDIIEKNEIILGELSECIPENSDLKAAEIEAVLNSFLRTLSERDCDIFIRRYYHMDSPSEIAQMYSLRDGNVRLTLHRIRKKLKAYLSEVLL